jgi:hypothetical protein
MKQHGGRNGLSCQRCFLTRPFLTDFSWLGLSDHFFLAVLGLSSRLFLAELNLTFLNRLFSLIGLVRFFLAAFSEK